MVGVSRGRVFPVIWRHDLGFDAGVLGEEGEQVGTRDQLDGLVLGEFEAGLAVAGGSDQDSFAGALVCRVPNRSRTAEDADGVFLAFGLDNDFAAEDGSGVVGDAVDSAVARWPGLACFQAQVLAYGYEWSTCGGSLTDGCAAWEFVNANTRADLGGIAPRPIAHSASHGGELRAARPRP